MLSLETCLKLKEAGFDCSRSPDVYVSHLGVTMRISYLHPFFTDNASVFFAACPTLEELLEAVKVLSPFRVGLDCVAGEWKCWHWSSCGTKAESIYASFSDPSEAVAALWLKLKGVPSSSVGS